MSLLRKMAGIEARSSPVRDPAIAEFLGGGSTSSSGMVVTPDTAIRLSAVFSCVRVLGEALASTPLKLYKRLPDGGRELAKDHRLYKTAIHPNSWQTRFSFFEYGMYQMNLEGAHHSRIIVMPNGRVVLQPIDFKKIRAVFNERTLEINYVVLMPDGSTKVFLQDEILRVPFMTKDGLQPLSVISAQREALGDSLSTQSYGSKFFANDATPRTYLQLPGVFKDKEQKKSFRDDWQEANGGNNRGKIAVVEAGAELKTIGISNEDAQYLETRKFQRSEIAGMFRVQSHLINDLERSTNNNIEQQSLEFITYTMMPWYTRWEQALTTTLLTDEEQDDYYFEFLADALLRGDSASRSQFYKDAIFAGWMNRNEVRIKENLNRADGLDEYIVPVNMTLTDLLSKQVNTNQPQSGAKDE